MTVQDPPDTVTLDSPQWLLDTFRGAQIDLATMFADRFAQLADADPEHDRAHGLTVASEVLRDYARTFPTLHGNDQ